MTQARPVFPVDWFRVLVDLKRAGFSTYGISQETGIPKATIQGYKAGAEPSHENGEKLVALWCTATANSRETVHHLDRYSACISLTKPRANEREEQAV